MINEDINTLENIESKKNSKPSHPQVARILLYVYLALNIIFIIINFAIYITNKAPGLVVKPLFFISLFIGVISVWLGVFVHMKLFEQKVVNEIFREIMSISVALLLITLFVGQLFGIAKVDGKSMTPSLKDKQVIMIKKYNNNILQYQTVVIDVAPSKKGNDKYIVKRVAATYGNWIGIRYNKNYNKYDIYVGLNTDLVGKPYEAPQVTKAYNKEGKYESDDYNLFHPLLTEIEAASLIDKLITQFNILHVGINFSSEELLSKNGNNIRIKIPKGMFFCLGDNYQNSVDSKKYGLFPRKQLVAIKVG